MFGVTALAVTKRLEDADTKRSRSFLFWLMLAETMLIGVPVILLLLTPFSDFGADGWDGSVGGMIYRGVLALLVGHLLFLPAEAVHLLWYRRLGRETSWARGLAGGMVVASTAVTCLFLRAFLLSPDVLAEQQALAANKNELRVHEQLNGIWEAQQVYKSRHGAYATSLAMRENSLLHPPDGEPLICDDFADGVRHSYLFRLSASQETGLGTLSWVVRAHPLHYGISGKHSFRLQSRGAINQVDFGPEGTKEMLLNTPDSRVFD